MDVDIELEGADPLLAAFAQSPQIVGQEMEKANKASLIMLAGEMKDYPPAPADSSYTRTLTLGRVWSTATPSWQTMSNGFWGDIRNPTPYGPRVQAQGFQAQVHRDRWQTDEQVLEANYERVKEQFEAGAVRVVNRLEGG